jgi:hypothetical protein
MEQTARIINIFTRESADGAARVATRISNATAPSLGIEAINAVVSF